LPTIGFCTIQWGGAFELVTDPKPADYLSPKGLRDGGDNYNLPRYLCVQNKTR